MMTRKTLLALAMTLLLPASLLAAIPDMKFRRLDTRDGLSNSQILTIYRDSKGFVWIGTPYGLNRYDGYRFKTYYSDMKDTMTLRNNYVDEIFEAFDGRFWLRQGMNYSIFDPATEQGDRHPERVLEKLGITGGLDRLYIDQQKDLWVKTYENSFWHYKSRTKKLHQYQLGFGPQDFNADFAISGFTENEKQLLVVSTNGEILCFDKESDRILWKNNDLRQNELVRDQDCKPRLDHRGYLWLVTTQSAFLYHLQSKRWFHSLQDALRAWGYENVPEGISVWDVQGDNEQRYWIATDQGGLYVCDPKDHEIRHFLTNKYDASTISDNTLRTIYRDQLGRMWVGTYMNGLNLYTGSLSNFQNLELGNINTVCADKQGYYWLGTNDRGILRYDPRTQEQQVFDKATSGIRSNTMVGSLAASDGSVWFGTYEGGLIRIKNGQVTNYQATGDTLGLANNNVWTVYEDQWGHIWIGTLGSGVQRIDKRTGRMRTLRMSNSTLSSDYINTITRTRKGWLMVTHSNYFSLVHPQTMQVVNRSIANNKSGVPVTESSIAGMEDSRGLAWQGSSSGATIWDPATGQVYLIDMKSGLFGSTVNGFIEDDRHTVWLATDHGVSNVIPQRQEDGTWSFVVRSYNNRDGLQNGPYNQRSMCYTPDGLILVGGQGGLDIINPKQMGKGRMKEKPLFSGLQIFDQDVNVGEEVDGRVILDQALCVSKSISLRFNDQFTIQLASNSGEVHNRSRFVYRLEGFNDNWVKTSELNPNITYNSLRAGTYILHVRMLNDDGTIGEEESQLEITIRPPLWRTRWMILLYMLLIAAAAWWWRKWFVKQQTKRMQVETMRRELEKQQWMNEMRLQIAKERAEAQRTVAATAAEEQPSDSPAEEQPLAVNRVETDLVDFVRQLCASYESPVSDRRLKLNFLSAVKHEPVDLDCSQMTEALHILFRNAVNFTPYDCRISVGVAHTADGCAQMQVADNGIGIQDEFKEHAFDPIVNGEGIGLDRVKAVVEAHEGTIRIEDNPGGGTIFVITLPVHPEEVIEEAVLMDDDE